FRAAMEACATAAALNGYQPDFSVCIDDVPVGRPHPWMIYRVMEKLNVYPPRAVVKLGDTVADIEEGVNAGVWSIGVVDSSNAMGLTPEEFEALPEEQREARRVQIREQFFAAGADGVVDTLADVPELIEELNRMLGTDENDADDGASDA
ncbi:MAG: HAD-IA family hydrolase, partial [Gemmataceae bacterium]